MSCNNRSPPAFDGKGPKAGSMGATHFDSKRHESTRHHVRFFARPIPPCSSTSIVPASSLATKNGVCMSIKNKERNGLVWTCGQHLVQSLIFIRSSQCFVYGEIWREFSIMNCLRRIRPSLWNFRVDSFADRTKQSSKNVRAKIWSDSAARQCPASYGKHDKGGRSGARLGDSSTSGLLCGPCFIGLPSFPLSPRRSGHSFFQKRHGASKLARWILCVEIRGFLFIRDWKTIRTLGGGRK